MKWLRRFATENVPLKLFSLALAVLLWILVGGDVQTEIFLPVPVEFRNVPQGVQFQVDPPRVEVRVRGLRHVVRQASETDFSIPVDIAALGGPGVKLVRLQPGNVEGPASLEIVDVTPAQLTITLQERTLIGTPTR
jgi:YbbR domain-containing protein